jgi:hypothetical protein
LLTQKFRQAFNLEGTADEVKHRLDQLVNLIPMLHFDDIEVYLKWQAMGQTKEFVSKFADRIAIGKLIEIADSVPSGFLSRDMTLKVEVEVTGRSRLT